MRGVAGNYWSSCRARRGPIPTQIEPLLGSDIWEIAALPSLPPLKSRTQVRTPLEQGLASLLRGEGEYWGIAREGFAQILCSYSMCLHIGPLLYVEFPAFWGDRGAFISRRGRGKRERKGCSLIQQRRYRHGFATKYRNKYYSHSTTRIIFIFYILRKKVENNYGGFFFVRCSVEFRSP